MYIQLTTACNMKCEHCCFSCGEEAGEYMQSKTFNQALELSVDLGENVALGGGEPTLHPEFLMFLVKVIVQRSLAIGSDSEVLVVTNGTNKKLSLMLAALAKSEVIHAELSIDGYHDYQKVDKEVIKIFTDLNKIRDVSGKEVRVGRYIQEVGEDWEPDGTCCCCDWLVQPNGKIKQCGCPNSPYVGDVATGLIEKYSYCSRICCNDSEFEDAIKDFENDNYF